MELATKNKKKKKLRFSVKSSWNGAKTIRAFIHTTRCCLQIERRYLQGCYVAQLVLLVRGRNIGIETQQNTAIYIRTRLPQQQTKMWMPIVKCNKSWYTYSQDIIFRVYMVLRTGNVLIGIKWTVYWWYCELGLKIIQIKFMKIHLLDLRTLNAVWDVVLSNTLFLNLFYSFTKKVFFVSK